MAVTAPFDRDDAKGYPRLAAALALAALAAATWRPRLRGGDDPRRRARHAGPTSAEGTGAPDGRRAAADRGRGRQATSPTEIPSAGWKDILLRTYKEVGEDRLLAVAAGIAFYALLALVPAITAFVSLYGLFANPESIARQLNALGAVVPEDVLSIVSGQVQRIAGAGGGQLGLAFAGGLAVALWSTNAGMKALIGGLNVIYDEDEKRGFVKLNLVSMALTLGAILFLLLALGALVVVPVVLSFVGLGGVWDVVIAYGRWPLLLVAIVLALSVLYRFGPSRTRPQWRWVSVGGIVAAVVWLVGSALFSWYLTNFADYNATYGSLGAVVGLMIWIWLTAISVLLGAEINAETEHQTARDTTRRPMRSMGRRGARMADTLGRARGEPERAAS